MTEPAAIDRPSVIAATGPVQVTRDQVWSAAVQNLGIAALVTFAYFHGKTSEEFWLGMLGYITGIDVIGKLMARKNPILALATGATGVGTHLVGK